MKRWKRRVVRALGWIGVLLLIVGSALVYLAWRPAGEQPSGARLDRIQASKHSADDRFFNALPEAVDYWGATKRWLWEGGDHRAPSGPLPMVESRPSVTAPNPGLSLTWLGHSSLVIQIDGVSLLTDPVFSERASPFTFMGPKRFHPPMKGGGPPTLPKLDAVVISHDHYDHLDYRTVEAMNRAEVPFIVPLGVGSHLEYWGVPTARITELEWWQTTSIKGVEIACTPSRHFSGRFLGDRNKTLWASWAIVGPKHRVYFSGDTAMFPGFAEIGAKYGPFDVTLMDAGAYDRTWADVHLGPEQAVAAHQMVRGKVLVPVHWGTFDLAVHNWTEPVERLLAEAERVGVKAFIPKPGETFRPGALRPIERWWPEVPWQTAAENPVVSSGL